MGKSFNTNVATTWISNDIKASEEKTNEVGEVKTEIAETKPATKKETGSASKEPKESKKTKQESAGFTIVGKEKKTRTTSFLLTETNYSKLSALAKKNGISVNSCINQILEQIL